MEERESTVLMVIQLLSASQTHNIYLQHPDGTLTPSAFKANYTPEGAKRIAATMNEKHPLGGGVVYVALDTAARCTQPDGKVYREGGEYGEGECGE